MSNKIKPVNNSSVDWAESHEALAPAEELLELMMAAGKEKVLWVIKKKREREGHNDGRTCVGKGCPERVEVEKLG